MSCRSLVRLVSSSLLVFAGLAAITPCLAVSGFVPAKRIGPDERPPYPLTAYFNALEGEVSVRLSIGETGKVTGAEITRCPGSKDHWKRIETSVLAWRFEPATKNGQPVASELERSYEFLAEWNDSLARMYPRPNKEVFEELTALFAELGLEAQVQDAENQLLLLNKRRYRKKRFPGVDPQKLPIESPRSFSLHCFVPPAVEPARVYCNGMLHSRGKRGLTGGKLERFVLDRLDARLGVPGRTIPVGQSRRFQLAKELSAGFADKKNAAPTSTSNIDPRIGPFEQSKHLLETKVKPSYPVANRISREENVLTYAAIIQEDGAVVVGRGSAKNPPRGFDAAARMALMFWRYAPTRAGDRPVPSFVTIRVKYSLGR